MSLKGKRILLSAAAYAIEWPDLPAANTLCVKSISIKSEVEAPPFLGNAVKDPDRRGTLTI